MARSYDTTVNIPKGKKLLIFLGKPSNENTPEIDNMILKDDITFSIGGTYSTVSDNNTTPLRSMVSNLLGKAFGSTVEGIVRGQNSKLGYQVFTAGKPLSISLNCQLMAVTDAFKEVIVPIAQLQYIMVPGENKTTGFLERVPGLDALEQIFDGYESSSYKKSKWGYIKIGKFSFYDVLFKDASVTFPTEVDQNGWPISANVTLDIETSRIITEESIREIYNLSETFDNVNEGSFYYRGSYYSDNNVLEEITSNEEQV